MACKQPPEGWTCTREPGHDGPCAALPAGEDGDTLTAYDEGVLDGIQRGMEVATKAIIETLRSYGLEQAAVLVEQDWLP